MAFIFILIFIFGGMLAGGLGMYLVFVKPKRPRESGHEFVVVEPDGAVRELNADEEFLLERNFYPGDPLMPSIKMSYDQKNEKGDLSGFILREKVPKDIRIQKKDYRAFNPN